MALGQGEGTSMKAASATGATSEGWAARPVGRRREDRIVGASRATERVIEQISAASRSDLPVLIVGPSGTGKEFAARAVHAWGSRAGAPFLTLACDALPEAIQARELFGSTSGVSPLLPNAQEGVLALAAGGSLLLEQIERLRNDVAETLARAIGERRFQRAGDEGSLALTARVIVAAEARPSGTFLGGIPHHAIELVPLAERREDILPLAAHFLASSAEEIGVAPVGFTADARAFLLAEAWPGNVRELRQRIRQAVRLSAGGAVSAEALLLAGDGDEIPSFKEAKRAFETRYVVNLLRRCSGNISRAARLAKKDRKDFYDVIRRTGIDPTQFR
jgi:two-component system response regulator GlrR